MTDNGLNIDWVPPNGKTVQGTVIARYGEDAFTTRLDIVNEPKRTSVLDKLAERWPALQEPECRQKIKEDLERIAADEATRAATRPKQDAIEPAATDRLDLLAKKPESVRQEAAALLQSEDLFARVVNDIGLLGVAGEKELSATVYLVGCSRLLERPLNAIVQGPSSSGKSYVIDNVAELFPPEAVIRATQMTPQAPST